MNVSSRIQITQEYARIGIKAERATQSIEQPRPDLEIKTQKLHTSVSMESLHGDLKIDSSKAYDALGIGSHLETMSRIYSIAKSRGIEAIGRIASEGSELANIASGQNAIAAIAKRSTRQPPEFNFNYAGEARYDNVDITYTPRKPEVNIHGGTLDISSRVNPPIIDGRQGKLDIYLQQRNSITITPPQIDVFK